MNEEFDVASLLVVAGLKVNLYPENTRLNDAYETLTTAVQSGLGGVFLSDSVKELIAALDEV